MQNNDNYNKRVLLATVLSTVLIFFWIKYYGKKTIPQEELKIQNGIKQEQTIEIKKEESIKENKVEGKNQYIEQTKDNTSEKSNLKIETENLKGSINLKGLVFDDLVLTKYKKEIGSNENVRLLFPQTAEKSYFVNFGWDSEDKNIDLPDQNTLWQANKDSLTINNPVILSYKNKNGLIFQIIISIDENYMFNFQQNVINTTDNTFVLKIHNTISRKMPIEFDGTVSVHQGFIGAFDKTVEEIKYAKLTKKSFEFKSDFDWAGWTDKYWLVVFTQMKDVENIRDVKVEYTNNNFIANFESDNITINANQIVESGNLLFTGPKILNLLDTYAFQYNLSLFDRAVDFGWFYFLTKPIYIILKMFYTLLGNFGVAILLLTLIVKMIMFPFTKKSFVSMARMKEIQPKVDNLKAKFSNDKMRLNKETMELYKKENISPLSGCLPMLVQIPVFFALYKVLVISIDMRQAPFIGYIKNLAEKDPTTIWNLFGLLPYHINFIHVGLLPCLMSLTMWIQQKMTTSVGGGAAAEAQTAVKLMPIIFLFLFAGMPAGLLVYWTFSNIISIAQQYYVEKRMATKVK
ncbi:MAG: membrane protein insertase YidC [Rickettsiales bacterium]|nr:membrane protein insertase YidC [Rickettsiales bacterium]